MQCLRSPSSTLLQSLDTAKHTARRLIPSQRIRVVSGTAHFYQNKQLEVYASRETKRLTLRQLIFYGRSINEDRLIKSANYVRTELPVRIAHRLRDLQTLPYVVVTQEGIAKVYELYWSAFEKFRRYPQINTVEENQAFCAFLRTLLDEHSTVIPSLSLGMSLSSPYLEPERLDSFMRRMLVSRISRRVLAEHHVALSATYEARKAGDKRSNDHYLRNRPLDIDNDFPPDKISKAEWSEVIVDGHLGTKFAYIREHLEYIIFELLKNSFRASRKAHPHENKLPPIRATIVAGGNHVMIRISDQGGGLMIPQIQSPSDLFSFSHVRNATRLQAERLGALRQVSTNPRGVWATVHEQVDNWQQTPDEFQRSTVSETEDNLNPHPRLGIGLPMSNIFATYVPFFLFLNPPYVSLYRYFGGSLELVSMDGYGTDVYVRLPRLGTNLELIEV
ncbi:alpha-ketoacid dehydrogenase kinase [Abortiporus biennis]|nr:alpha-ketoacid dehydrogenase kinase [Abortiporus biennis]